MTLSKIGPHIQQLTNPAKNWAQVAPVIKGCSEVGCIDNAPVGAFTIYRHFWPDQNAITPEQAALDILQALAGRKPSCVEYKNEWRQFGWENLASHIEETKRFTELMHQNGLKVAGFSFSVGCPEPSDWGAVKEAKYANVDYLAIHEYWGRFNRDTGIVGYLDDWAALRHRRIHGWLGREHPNMIITEAGCDNVYGWGGGWKAQGIDAQTYANEISAWNKELEKDSYIVGATIFGAGPYGWEDFNTDSMSDQLLVPLYDGTIPTLPISPPPLSGFRFRYAFNELARKYGGILGLPLEDIQYDYWGNARQTTTTGVAYSLKMPDGTWKTWFHEQVTGKDWYL